MGGLASKLIFKKGKDKLDTTYSSLWDIGAIDIDGNKINNLGDICHGKKCVMVVNVASK